MYTYIYQICLIKCNTNLNLMFRVFLFICRVIIKHSIRLLLILIILKIYFQSMFSIVNYACRPHELESLCYKRHKTVGNFSIFMKSITISPCKCGKATQNFQRCQEAIFKLQDFLEYISLRKLQKSFKSSAIFQRPQIA